MSDLVRQSDDMLNDTSAISEILPVSFSAGVQHIAECVTRAAVTYNVISLIYANVCTDQITSVRL